MRECELRWRGGGRAAGISNMLRSTMRVDPIIAMVTQQSTGDLTPRRSQILHRELLELSGGERARHPFLSCCCSLGACVERTFL